MKIGSFSYDRKSDSYFGDIETLSVRRTGVMIKPARRNGTREPDYQIIAQDGEMEIDLGVAWKKTSERGQSYLSVVLDDPAFPARCNAALFLDEHERAAELVWTRNQPRQDHAPQRATAGGNRKSGRATAGPSP